MGADDFKKGGEEKVHRQRTGAGAESGGFCQRFGKKLFMTMFPEKKKVATTKQGKWLRMMFAICTFLHALFALVSLAFVGAEAMYSA